MSDSIERLIGNVSGSNYYKIGDLFNRNSKDQPLFDLPIGTRLWVTDGNWYGQITEEAKNKVLLVEATKTILPITYDISYNIIDLPDTPEIYTTKNKIKDYVENLSDEKLYLLYRQVIKTIEEKEGIGINNKTLIEDEIDIADSTHFDFER